MIYIKYTVLLGIFIGTTVLGILLSKKYKNRVKELKELVTSLNILESKIKFTHEPLGDIFKELSSNKENISNIYKTAHNNLKENDIKTAWKSAIEQEKKNLNLNNEDIEIITSLGNILRTNWCRRSNQWNNLNNGFFKYTNKKIRRRMFKKWKTI